MTIPDLIDAAQAVLAACDHTERLCLELGDLEGAQKLARAASAAAGGPRSTLRYGRELTITNRLYWI
jgi:hypothetical protein